MEIRPDCFEVSLDGNVTRRGLAYRAQKRELLQMLATCDSVDLSIEHCEGSILVVLLNATRAFVMWLPEAGDEGQHAVDERGNSEGVQRFRLSNGQVDEFSDYDTVSRDLALESVFCFIERRLPSPHLRWASP